MYRGMTMKTPDHATPREASHLTSATESDEPRVLGRGKGLFDLPVGFSGHHEKLIQDMFETAEPQLNRDAQGKSDNILRIEIQPAQTALARFGETLTQLEAKQPVQPYAGIGFESLPQFIEIFTPKRWELIAALKQTGPSSIYALAKKLSRHYRNVHKDVTALTEWMVLEKDEQGRVFVPWDEIDVRLPLLKAA